MKYKSIKNFSTTDWGKVAIIGILAGMISSVADGYIIFQIILDVCGVFGFIALCVWVYRKVNKI